MRISGSADYEILRQSRAMSAAAVSPVKPVEAVASNQETAVKKPISIDALNESIGAPIALDISDKVLNSISSIGRSQTAYSVQEAVTAAHASSGEAAPIEKDMYPSLAEAFSSNINDANSARDIAKNVSQKIKSNMDIASLTAMLNVQRGNVANILMGNE